MDADIEIEMTETVKDLIEKIRSQCGILNLELEYDGDKLDEDTVLNTINIAEGTYIKQVIVQDPEWNLKITKSNGEEFNLIIEPGKRVFDLKQKIAMEIGPINPTEQLIYNQTLLDPDNNLLSLFGITNGSTIGIYNFGIPILTLNIKQESGNSFQVDVAENDYLSTLKSLIQAFVDANTRNMFLTFQGMEIEDGIALHRYGIKNKSEVLLKIIETEMVSNHQINIFINLHGKKTPLTVSRELTDLQLKKKINDTLLLENSNYKLVIEKNPDGNYNGFDIEPGYQLKDFNITNGSIIMILDYQGKMTIPQIGTPSIPPLLNKLTPIPKKNQILEELPNYVKDTNLNIYWGNKTIFLKANVKYKIKHLKIMIEQKENIKRFKQTLLKRKMVMEDEMELQYYDFKPKMFAYLNLNVDENDVIKIINNNDIFEVVVNMKDDIRKLKKHIYDKRKIQVNLQTLSIMGTPLNDDFVLENILKSMAADDAIELKVKECILIKDELKNKSFYVSYKADNKIRNIQQQIMENTQIPIVDQILLLNNKRISNNTKLLDIKKERNTVLSLYDRNSEGDVEVNIINYCGNDFKLKVFPFDNGPSIKKILKEKRDIDFSGKGLYINEEEMKENNTIGSGNTQIKDLYILYKLL